jgi:hypothetical protein
MRFQRTIAEVTQKVDETPPRKLCGKSGHCYNSDETLFFPFLGRDIKLAGSVLYLADEASISTTSTANTKPVVSENIACNGCR